MLVIGLTGGIGSGKTTVADLFAEHGIPIIDADVLAREVTLPDQPAFIAIVNHFGKAILLPDGTLNRKQLRQIIFDHANEKSWLEKLLHPLIRQILETRIKTLPGPYCIAVVPLLLEVTPYPFIDRILVIDAPTSLQIERVGKRDQVSADLVESIMKTQMKREHRLEKAHDVILNDGDLSHLATQVENLHKKYLAIAKEST